MIEKIVEEINNGIATREANMDYDVQPVVYKSQIGYDSPIEEYKTDGK